MTKQAMTAEKKTKKKKTWRDGSECFKSVRCSYRETATWWPQPSVTLVPGYLMPSSDDFGIRHACGAHTYMQAEHSLKSNS